MRGKVLFFVAVLGLAGCGDNASPRASIRTESVREMASVPAHLIPADAVVVIHLESLDIARAMSKAIEQAVGGASGQVDRFIFATGVNPDDIDMSRPVAIAVTMTATSPLPLPTYVLPVRNGEAVVRDVAMNAVVAGDYVGLSMVSGYEAGAGSKLMQEPLPSGVVIRVDLARVMELYGGTINMQLDMAQQMAAGAVQDGASGPLDTVFGTLRDMADSAEQLEIVAGMEKSVLNVDGRFTVREKSPLDREVSKSGLGELATHLPADFPLVMLFSLDLSSVMHLFDFWTGRMPNEQRALFDKQLAAMKEMVKDLGEDWAGGVDLGADGIRFVCAGRAKDSAGYVQKYVDFVGSEAFREAGVLAKPEGKREVGGATVHRVRLKIDPEKYAAVHGSRAGDAASFFAKTFGEQGAVVDLAAKGDRIIVTVDKAGVLCEQVLAGRGVPPGVASSLKRVPGELGFLLHLDLRGLMSGVATLSRAAGKDGVPEVPEGGPVPIAVYGSRSGRVYAAGFSLELDQTGALAHLWK